MVVILLGTSIVFPLASVLKIAPAPLAPPSAVIPQSICWAERLNVADNISKQTTHARFKLIINSFGINQLIRF
jgi:hypothetical protein